MPLIRGLESYNILFMKAKAVQKSICNSGAFFCPLRGQKNRAIRSKSSDLPRMHGRAAILLSQNRDQPMQILWAFRSYPLRSGSLDSAPGIANGNSGAANCLWQLAAHNQAVAILLGKNCVVCHQPQRVTRCARLYHQPAAAAPAAASGIATGNSAGA
ncbi:MAG: hypothetical protein LBK13_04570 [Spirochaetales bacterium]|jgi:hypothetical protein|nr:hypothetical protein [Spirochaetales bacterium]